MDQSDADSPAATAERPDEPSVAVCSLAPGSTQAGLGGGDDLDAAGRSEARVERSPRGASELSPSTTPVSGQGTIGVLDAAKTSEQNGGLLSRVLGANAPLVEQAPNPSGALPTLDRVQGRVQALAAGDADLRKRAV